MDAGWADLAITVGDRSVDLRGLSHLSDSLRDLASSGVSVLRGHPETLVRFQKEPGEVQLAMIGADPLLEHILIRVHMFADNFSAQTANLGSPLFEATCSRRALAKAIFRAFAVWKNAQADYQNRWGFSFPQAEFDGLESALS